LGASFILGFLVVLSQAKFFHFTRVPLDDLLIWLLVPGVVGARLYHLATDWRLYQGASVMQLLAIWNGGLGYIGALIGSVVGLALFLLWQTKKEKKQRRQLFVADLFALFDLLAFGAPLAQAIGRWGNFINQELYGPETTLPWGVWINGKRYHPLFAYESILDLVLFLFLLFLSRKKALVFGKGQYAALYISLYGLIRFWLEFLRPDTDRFAGSLGVLSIAQWVCLGFMIAGTTLFWVRRHSPKKAFDFSLE
jgi:prolipoprotein diacylglyceryl transferase